jgi:geranylgeranyl transferase type-1 subunit beta
LNAHQHIDAPADAAWLLGAQHAVGGLGKTQGEMPDLLHSYLGLAALSMHVHEHEHGDDEAPRDRDAQHTQLSRQLARLDAAMNCTQETRLWLRASLEGME